MKKILMLISSIFIVGCAEYTVKVEQPNVKINGTAVNNGDCVPFQTILWDFVGDFPIEVQIGNGEATEHATNNYVIAGGQVKETETACEVEEEGEEELPAAGTTTGTDGASATGTTTGTDGTSSTGATSGTPGTSATGDPNDGWPQ